MPLTNGTLFRVDATGLNLASSGGHVNFGVWSTVQGVQNIPGNYGGQLFIARSPNPGPGDFLSPSTALSIALASGDNVFYFFANGDDARGGSYGFGVNLWLGTAAAGAPALSGFAAAPGGTLMVDTTSGCSPAYDDTCTTSANTLMTTGAPMVTLTDFRVTGIGGGVAGTD